MSYRYAVADGPAQHAQIHALNHDTFVGEIPQHAPTADGRLVDAFDDENTYLVALDGDTVVGMLALRDRRPFSLDRKLPDLDAHLPPERPVVEIRLLAVRPERRHGRAFHGLMGYAARWMVQSGFRLAIISGSTARLGLYSRMGFRPFGPLVGSGEVTFQPMVTTLADAVRVLPGTMPPTRESVSLLPGPVELAPAVRAAMSQPPISHRGAPFLAMHARVVGGLRALLGAREVALMVGTGTLANDAVGARLAAWGAPGLVLSNGEFGNRLADHARRHGLDHEVLRAPWGQTHDLDALAARLRQSGAAWVWAVHGETSTGVLTDLARLAAITTEHGARLCLDAVSTIGAVPVDLAGVTMASGVSGKALGAPAGLSFVAYGDLPPATRPVPRYLDLDAIRQAGGVPCTSSSPLVAALDAALAAADGERMVRLQRQGLAVRRRMCAAGLRLVAPDGALLPTVQTVALDEAEDVGRRLEDLGILTSYRSDYLRERGWLQLCTMGELDDATVEAAADMLCAAIRVGQPESAESLPR